MPRSLFTTFAFCSLTCRHSLPLRVSFLAVMAASMGDQYYGSSEKLLARLREKIRRLAYRLRLQTSPFLTDVQVILQEIIDEHRCNLTSSSRWTSEMITPAVSIVKTWVIRQLITFPQVRMFFALLSSLNYFTPLFALVKFLFLVVNQLLLSVLICSPRYLHESNANMPGDFDYKDHCRRTG